MRHHTYAGGGSIAYDVATALICAPDASSVSLTTPLALLVNGGAPPLPPQKRLTLREALRYEAEDCKKLQKTDQVMAETVVRLYRKVEAQMVMPQAQEAILDTSLDLGLDNAAAAETVWILVKCAEAISRLRLACKMILIFRALTCQLGKDIPFIMRMPLIYLRTAQLWNTREK